MDVRSLTQQEAEQRAALLAVERYDVSVDLTDLPTGPAVRATSTVTFRCRRPGAETFVDCAAEVVTATLNGRRLPAPAQGRIPLAGLAERNVLVVESLQSSTTDGGGVHKATDPADGEVYLWTSFEPDEARHVWACFDQPDLKAPHRFTVTAPATWRVVSNSGDPVVEDAADGSRAWTFPDTPPLSTYNPVILAGPFHEIRRDAGGHDLGILARRSLKDLLERDAEEIFSLTEQGLGFFADRFGMPFPQRKYDQVFLPEFGGAMENYGCVAWSDGFLVPATPTPAERQLLARVLLHEMAHMWFGNIVTMRWWDDLWLNEAFAEFACNWAASRATAYTGAWAGHLANYKIGAYLADQGPTTHPIRQPIHDVAQAASIFDAITYPKGASVLLQLMTYVGEESFVAGMRSYFARHAWGNTTLQDLVDALSESSGRALDEWRAAWLERAGTDRLTLQREGHRFVLVGSGPDGSDPRPQVLGVGSFRRTADGLERVGLAHVELRGRRTPVDLPDDADLHLVNDGDLTFATTRPTEDAREALFALAGELPDALSRGVAVATVWDMLANGEAGADETVRCLVSVLRKETAGSVVERYLALACDAVELWSSARQRPALAADVAAQSRQLAADPARRQVALRSLARVAPDEAEVAWLQEQAGDDVDLLWRALRRKAETVGVQASEVDDLLARDPHPEAWVRALAVRAAVPSPEAKAEAWEALTTHKVPVAAVTEVTAAFWRPGQDALLAPYADRYLALLPHLHEGGMIPAMVYSARLFPVFGIEPGFLPRVEAALAQVAPVVAKRGQERADEVRRMLAARSR